MKFSLARKLTDLNVDRARWNELAENSASATIFQTKEWFDCWWAAFGRGKELYVVTMWENEVLVGIAPLMIVRRNGLRRLEFVGTPNSDYQDFILGTRASELMPELVHFLFSKRDDWDMIVLRNVPSQSPSFTILPNMMRSLGLGAIDEERIACPTLAIASRASEIGNWLDRYSLRRRVKQLRRLGDLDFTRCMTSMQLDFYLPLFFEQYVERRRGTPAAKVFKRPDVREFFTCLAKSMLASGWLHFSVLECAGRPAAFHFGFEYGDRMYWYKPSFDVSLARHSPGKVLLSYLIRDSLDRNLRELDFTVGDEAFKARYTSTSRTNANLRVFRQHWLYFIVSAMFWVSRKLRRLRSSP